MTFLTKTNHPISFIPTGVLVESKKLINRKIRYYQQEARDSNDMEFIEGRKKKIVLLKLIIADLKEIIITLGS